MFEKYLKQVGCGLALKNDPKVQVLVLAGLGLVQRTEFLPGSVHGPGVL